MPGTTTGLKFGFGILTHQKPTWQHTTLIAQTHRRAGVHVLPENELVQGELRRVRAVLEGASTLRVIWIIRDKLSRHHATDFIRHTDDVLSLHPQDDVGVEGAAVLDLVADDIVDHSPNQVRSIVDVVAHEVLDFLVEEHGALDWCILETGTAHSLSDRYTRQSSYMKK